MTLRQKGGGRHKTPERRKAVAQNDGMRGKKCELLGEDWWQTESLISREPA